MESFSLLIDGKLVAGNQTMPVINPATEETFAPCPRASVDQPIRAVAAGKAAFSAWAATSIDERRTRVGKIADVIEQDSGELARLLLDQHAPRHGTAYSVRRFQELRSGVELGEEGLAEFTQLQVINMAR